MSVRYLQNLSVGRLRPGNPRSTDDPSTLLPFPTGLDTMPPESNRQTTPAHFYPLRISLSHY